ncbi:MAG: Spy/CpxP family protein refolding chaperone [Ferruginibacter sp.]
MKLLNYKWLGIGTLILLLVNITVLIFLWTAHKNEEAQFKNGPKNGPGFEYLIQSLNFDSSQKLAFTKLKDAHRTNARLLQDSLKKSRDQFFGLLKNEPNDSLLNVYAQKNTAIIAQIDILNFKHFQDIKKICTPDQLPKFDTVIVELIRTLGAQGRGPGPGFGPREGGRRRNDPKFDNEPPPPLKDGERPPPPRD